jgi:hypothetical protein
MAEEWRFKYPAGAGGFTLLHGIRTVSAVFCLMGNRGYFPWGKLTRV